MARFAVLLRGVNVAGHRRVPMARFREILGALGYSDVRTYLQSGNAVVTTPSGTAGAVAGAIRQALIDELDVDTAVLLRTPAQLAKVVRDNPLPDEVAEPKRLHVAFLFAAPTAAAVRAIDTAAFLPDRLEVVGDSAYVYYADGASKPRIPASAFTRLGVEATARNWNTVLALREMLG